MAHIHADLAIFVVFDETVKAFLFGTERLLTFRLGQKFTKGMTRRKLDVLLDQIGPEEFSRIASPHDVAAEGS